MLVKQFKLLFIISLVSLLISGCSSTDSIKQSFKGNISLKQARYGHAAVNDGDKLYVFGGSNKRGFLSDIEIIDPSTQTSELLKDKLIPRRYFSAVWDGAHSIYILGGMSYENRQYRQEPRVEVFNTLTKEVTFVSSLSRATRLNSAVYKDGKIYNFGGSYIEDRKRTVTDLVAVYDVATNVWTKATAMPTAKETKAFVQGDYIYVLGGYDYKTGLDTFERYDPQSNEWTTLPTLPTKISAHSVTVAKNKLFVFGDYKELNLHYSYDFDSQVWQKLDVGFKPSRHNAATTMVDTIYVIGGNTGGSGPFLDYVQVFDVE